MSAIVEVYPRSLNKLCLHRTNQNIRKHVGSLEEGALAVVLRQFHAAACAQTEEVSNLDAKRLCHGHK